MTELTHYAGPVVNFRGHLRQRCMWCGTALIDQQLELAAVQQQPADRCGACDVERVRHDMATIPDQLRSAWQSHDFEEANTYPTWPVGGFIARDGDTRDGDPSLTYVVAEDYDGPIADLQPQACMILDPETTS